MTTFYEYAVVVRKTADLDRLERLYGWRVDQTRAELLVRELTRAYGLQMPKLSFTGWTERGHYWSYEHRIQVRKDDIGVEILIHELAHHWVYSKMTGRPSSPHGPDFVHRLDKLAETADSILGNKG